MRHRKAGRKLKRTASHRKALLASLATSLLRHKRITTTVAKAKETRVVVEKIITRSKRALAGASAAGDGAAAKFVQSAGPARREVGRVIRDRAVVTELFATIAPKVASRPGGYTRIVKLGQRQGDGAELAVIELVDFQTGQEKPSGGEGETKATKKAAPKKKTSTKEKDSSRKKKKAEAGEGAS
jgi:large subunit ribosomal protein L17